jgi:Amt family ammonium transporter
MRKVFFQAFTFGLLLICVSPARLSARQLNGGTVWVTMLVAPRTQFDRMAAVEEAAAEAKSSADNAWMLASSALVLLMTGPGLALFYGGLVRKKNVLGTMMQSFAMMAVITAVWAIIGYSLAFGSGNSLFGGLSHVLLRGVGAQPDPSYSATIAAQAYMVFQLMFAIITPALITGAFAERMKFSALQTTRRKVWI